MSIRLAIAAGATQLRQGMEEFPSIDWRGVRLALHVFAEY